jgi:Skp family chaperone for outer membrane proteins
VACQQTKLMKKHALGIVSFQKKVQSKIDAMKKQRAIELEQLLQKYQNIKNDLDNHQMLEIKKLQKRPMNSSTSQYLSNYNSHGGTYSKKPPSAYKSKPVPKQEAMNN